MGAVNRAYLRNLARTYADGRPGGASAFVPDSDAAANAVSFDTLTNGCLAELYDLLVAARGHEYYESDADLSIVSGTSRYDLPADFYQLLSVRLYWSSTDIEELHQMGIRERSRYERLPFFDRWTPKAFRLRGTQTASARSLELMPIPTQAVTANVRYIPTFQPLADDAAVFDGVNGWEDLVALKAAIKYRTVAEKPIGNLQNLYNECLARITGLADQRAANFAEQIQQVFPERGRRRAFRGAPGAGYGIFDDTYDGSFD